MSPDVQLIKELSEKIGVNIHIIECDEKVYESIDAKVIHIINIYKFFLENNNNALEIISIFILNRKLDESDSYCLVGNKGEVIILCLDGILLRHMPEQVCKLKKLSALFLHNNQLSSLNGIAELESLELLYLGGKQDLSELPEEISNLSNLKGLFLPTNSRFTVPPQEIVDQGLDAVTNYFESLRESSEVSYLYEAKMVVIGRGFAGKTSLIRKLTIPNYRLEEDIKSTEGIDIKIWDVKLPLQKSDSFRFNIWDFAGQEKYDATHQFFITERTLYIFVTEARQESNYLDFDYWLNIVQLLGNNSPVIVVQNKIDVRQKQLPTSRYRARFSNIISFVDVSCTDGHEDTIEELIKKIKLGIRKLPQVGDQLPIEWVDIRKELESYQLNNSEKNLTGVRNRSGLVSPHFLRKYLESRKRDYIYYEDYLRICAGRGLNQKKADYLSRYFHDLGVVVHYHKDPLLKKMVVVNPDWVVDGAYSVLDNRRIAHNNGRFNDADLQSIWDEPRYKDKHPELLALMKNYELCFELGHSGTYIAPELLSPNPVKFKAIKGPERLTFMYEYEFMPAGILTRFIVKIHQLIEENQFWRHGVIVAFEDARASIIENDIKKTVRIDIEGEKGKKELLAIIRKEFSVLHSDFNDIRYQEFIPCRCSACQIEENATHFFKWKTVLRRYHKNKRTIACEESDVDVDVKALMGEIPTSLDELDVFKASMSNVPTTAQEGPAQRIKKPVAMVDVRSPPEKKGEANKLFFFYLALNALGLLGNMFTVFDLTQYQKLWYRLALTIFAGVCGLLIVVWNRSQRATWIRVGEFLLIVLITLGFGWLTYQSYQLDVDNNCPNVRLTVAPEQIKPGERAKLSVQADDPEHDPLNYSWEATIPGLQKEGGPYESALNEYTASAEAAGEKVTITAHVDDNQCGKQVSQETTITILLPDN